jgi:hypothetical protein
MSLLETMQSHIGNEPYDIIMFVPHPEQKDSLHIEFLNYKDPGENVGSCDLGHKYDILLFEENDAGEFHKEDRFQAILTAPIEYAARMAKSKIYGIIGRKTTTSDEFFDDFQETLGKEDD